MTKTFTYTQSSTSEFSPIKISRGNIFIGEFYVEIDGDWVLQFNPTLSGCWNWYALQELSNELIALNTKDSDTNPSAANIKKLSQIINQNY